MPGRRHHSGVPRVFYMIHLATAGVLPRAGVVGSGSAGFLFLLCGFRRDKASKSLQQTAAG